MRGEKFLFILIGVVIGWGTYYFFRPKLIPESIDRELIQCSIHELQMKDWGRKDFQDYIATTDPTLKAKKGDELLSKIMMLFIADIGVRMSQLNSSQQTEIGQSQNNPADNRGGAITKTETGSHPVANETRGGLQVQAPPPRFVVTNEVEIPDAVKKHEKENLFSTVRSSQPITHAHIRYINGTFVGEITMHNGDEPWGVEHIVSIQISGNKVSGTAKLKFSKQGKVFSDHNSEGEVDFFTGTPNSIVVKANGDKGYMELFSAENLGMLVGTYYDKKSVDRFVPIGTVVLRRQ